MKVFYRSALLHQEITRDSVLRTVPSRACLEIQKERGDQDVDVLLNGNLVDSDKTTIEIDNDAELVVRSRGDRTVYSVKPLVRKLSSEYAAAYEEFQYEYNEKPDNEIESICAGFLKMYAVDKSSEVHDWTDIFEKIELAYPAFKNICEKPKSHLKSVNEVRPIETVKRIGYESIPYLAAHSEDWLARTASGLKPARLFSRVEDDEYQIYENRVVKTLIDMILSFLRKKEKELKDQYEQLHGIINSGVQTGNFGFDVSFQKAVAELLVADNKGDEYRSKALDLVEKLHDKSVYLLKKYRTLRQTRLYRYLRKAKTVNNPLNETNILLMDKHYSVAYKLWKDIHKVIAPQQIAEEEKIELKYTYDDYLLFCKTLCGYTAHVLNFGIETDGLYYRSEDNLELSIVDNDGLISMILCDREKRFLDIPNYLQVPIQPGENAEGFTFDGQRLYWNNTIDLTNIERFCSMFKTRESRGKEQYDEKKRYSALKQAIDSRQREYPEPMKSKVVICPTIVELDNDNRNSFKAYIKEQAENIAADQNADYVIVALPCCNEDEQKIIEYAKEEGERVLILPLTMFDINSFRRIQNLLLRQIVSFEKGKCPCCGGKMRKSDNRLVCDSCNQLILTETVCPNPECKNQYYYISYDLSPDTINKMRAVDTENFYQVDSLYQYKDIVEMSVGPEKVRTVCPKCHQC